LNLILGICGSLASGKSIAANALSSKYNIPIFSFGKMIENILLKEGHDPIRGNLQEKGMEIIERIGYDGIATLLLNTYNITKTTPCIIEGIRHVDVVSFYKKEIGNGFFCIFIDSTKEARFNRIQGIEYKKLIVNTKEEFEKIDNHEIERQINAIKSKADLVINNNATKNDFISTILAQQFDDN
jgi:dephospho-CoA kinase